MQAGGWCYGQSGHAHKMGDKGEFSGTGGQKWGEGNWQGNYGPKNSEAGLLIDLITFPPVYTALMGKNWTSFNPDTLGKDCNAPARIPNQLDNVPAY